MKPLRLYLFFHLNLAYSSIEEEERAEVIQHCYWPLLKLVRNHQLPVGIEVTGYTLEVINIIDPAWISELSSLCYQGIVELIGSGYSQIIGPLVPAGVNRANLRLGNKVYELLLGFRPDIALVNEQAYSAGLVQNYVDAGYRAITMEWNNPRKYSQEWENEWRYFPQYAIGLDGETIPLIWADSIAFQKFQRFAHGELNLDEYIEYLNRHVSDKPRVFPIYCNDVEIFDFRPGRYKTETVIHKRNEWKRIKVLFQAIRSNKRFQLIPPGNVLDFLNCPDGGNKICLESSEQPIPVKKQEKYNINRWALTGRDDLNINTKCYQIYKMFITDGNPKPSEEDWKELCYLWSSDFRTHITEKRWFNYLERLYKFHDRCKNHANCKGAERKLAVNGENEQKIIIPYKNYWLQCLEDQRYLIVETDSIKCILNKQKGLAIDSLWFKNVSTEPLIGTLPHGYYDDISMGADFYSGHIIIERPGEHKITDLQLCVPEIIKSLHESKVCITCQVDTNDIRFKKEYLFDYAKENMTINYTILIPSRKLSTIHLAHITLIPTSFDKDSLFYATHNGGYSIERFEICKSEVYHSQNLSHLVSAKYGLGATEGIITFGDNNLKITIRHDQTLSALIPSVQYLPMDEMQYFFRLQYSAQEMDETFVENSEFNKLVCRLEIDSNRIDDGQLL